MVQRLTRKATCVEVYWGGDPHQRMELEQTPQKIRKGLEDQLRLNGKPVDLWLPVGPDTAGVVPCTCDKNTTQSADFKCVSCFGMRFVPGYQKFLHQTLHWSSAEALLGGGGGYTLAGLVADRTKKPNRLTLPAGTASGVLTTSAKAFANPALDEWAIELGAYRKQAGDTVALEASLDGGAFVGVPLIGGPLFGYRATVAGQTWGAVGSLAFRVTVGRASGGTPEPPSFEVLRARHVRSRDVNPIVSRRSDYVAGQILILRTWDQELVAREIARGRTVEALGDRSWTAPLDFFDLTLTHDTPAVAFDDREAGPHPLFEHTSGVRIAQRYAIYAINLDTTINNTLTHQSFSERRTQAGELYGLVF